MDDLPLAVHQFFFTIELPFMKILIQKTSSILALAFSTSVFAHNGEHAEISTLSSIASHITHLLSEAGHMASIAVITLIGLVAAKILRKVVSKALQQRLQKNHIHSSMFASNK